VPVELARILAEVWATRNASNVPGIVVEPGEAAFVIPHVWTPACDFVGMDDIVINFSSMSLVIVWVVGVRARKPLRAWDVLIERNVAIPVPNVVT
jgi:hypothetical protein